MIASYFVLGIGEELIRPADRHPDENRDPHNAFNLPKGSRVGARDDIGEVTCIKQKGQSFDWPFEIQ